MSQNIAGKVVVITGASSGLGEATARHLSRTRRDRRAGRAARSTASRPWPTSWRAGRQGPRRGRPTSRDADQVQRLVDAAVEAFGRIDVIINNAGLMPHSPLERRKVEDWDRMIDVNLKGVLYGIAAALPHMQQQKAGHIINVSSVAGHKVRPGGRRVLRDQVRRARRSPRGCGRR